MKRICYTAMLSLLLFTSCGYAGELSASQSVPADGYAEESGTNQAVSTDFDSYISFSVKSEVTDEELDEIARILESRLADGYQMLHYQLTPQYDTDALRLEFDYIEGWTELFMERAPDKNILEVRKGNTPDGELLLTNDNVRSADETLVDYGGDDLWAVAIVLDEDGSKVFADATAELAGTDTPISIWLDNELLYAPLVNNQITDGNVILSGDFDVQSAENLAIRIRSVPLPYDVIIDTYEFGIPE